MMLKTLIEYLDGKTSGSLEFIVPNIEGTYNFRMFEDNCYKLLSRSSTFTVFRE